VVTEYSVRSENTGVPIIREIMLATTMSFLFVAFFTLIASTFRTRAALQAAAVIALGQNNTPKEPFTIVIKVETPIVKAGSGVSVSGRLTNVSNQPIDASGCYCGPSGLDSYVTWEVRDEKGYLAAKRIYSHPELATGSAILDRIINPGESLTGSQDISRLYDMGRPGKYVIQALRQTSDTRATHTVKSNKVTVTVIP
jgi:hypothetical protein